MIILIQKLLIGDVALREDSPKYQQHALLSTGVLFSWNAKISLKTLQLTMAFNNYFLLLCLMISSAVCWLVKNMYCPENKLVNQRVRFMLPLTLHGGLTQEHDVGLPLKRRSENFLLDIGAHSFSWKFLRSQTQVYHFEKQKKKKWKPLARLVKTENYLRLLEPGNYSSRKTDDSFWIIHWPQEGSCARELSSLRAIVLFALFSNWGTLSWFQKSWSVFVEKASSWSTKGREVRKKVRRLCWSPQTLHLLLLPAQ